VKEKSIIDSENQFIEWDGIFNSYKGLLRKRQSEKHSAASNKFKAFLRKDGIKFGYRNSERFLVKRFLSKDISLFFRQFLLDENAEGKLTIESCSQILSIVNKILLFAEKSLLTKDTNILLHQIKYSSEGNNHGHESYSDMEVEQIKNVLRQELLFVDRVIQNPKYVSIHKDTKSRSEAFIEAVRLFEDPECMNSIAIPATNRNQRITKKHTRFFNKACGLPGGLRKFYMEIGVMDLVDARAVGCLLLKLAIETGYNPCSLFSLKVDCLKEKTLPFGNPAIEFEKNRSGGVNTMPILLFDSDPYILDLKQKQYLAIKKTITTILSITSRIRENAKDEIKEFLFIYESRGGNKFGKISRFDDKVSYSFCKQLVSDYELKDSNAAPLKLRLVRFRSTKLTQMVKDGFDIFEIQAVAVHGNIKSTIQYINIREIEPKLDAEVKYAVERIYETYTSAKDSQNDKVDLLGQRQNVFKGFVSNCKNPFDPPEEIKRIQNYKHGKPCTYFNMCLSCPNVIITKFHLPLLINYRNQILNSAVIQNNEGPHPHIYRKSLAILNSLLDEEKSLFSKAELDVARRKAEQLVDEVIDPLFNVPSTIKIR